VRASIDLGHSLRLESVAEGVEDGPTWEVLSALGCDMAQGYFISPPLLGEEVLPWLATWKDPRSRSVHRAA
jgi:EAL domain-containing protein (putative c-di-GMP-specific phosphodiesterase class I)